MGDYGQKPENNNLVFEKRIAQMDAETRRMIESIMKLIAGQFGPKCEVVLHDWANEYHHTIVAIENGKVTGRKVGGSGSNLGLEVLRGTRDGSSQLSYLTRTKDGKLLRSSTMYLEDETGRKIGALCINYDISDLLAVQNTISDMTLFPLGVPGTNGPHEFFSDDVNEMLDFLIEESMKLVDKDSSELTKEDKKKIVSFLDKKGALLITKSGEKICRQLGISKFTLYNYLEELRQEEQ